MNKPQLDFISSQPMLHEIINLAFEKKAEKLVALDLRGLSSFTDYFVICHGNSEPQVKAIVDHIRKGTSYKPKYLEGYDNKNWILMDYFDIIVHVFDKDEREYYQIERIWGDAPLKEFTDEKI